MCINFENAKLKQSEIENQLGFSLSTLQRYRNDVNVLSMYRNHPNYTNKRTEKASNTNFENNSQSDYDLKQPQMTSNDLRMISEIVNEHCKKVETKNNIKGGLLHENGETNDHYLDEVFQKNDS